MRLPILLLMLCPAALAAPREVATGKGSNNSSPFTAAGAYELTWSASFPSPDLEWITVMVMDADTDRMVASAATQPKAGKLFVPQGGRHFLQVMSAADAWLFQVDELPPPTEPQKPRGENADRDMEKPVEVQALELRAMRLGLAMNRLQRDLAKAPRTAEAVASLSKRSEELGREMKTLKRDAVEAAKRNEAWITEQKAVETEFMTMLRTMLAAERAKRAKVPGLPPGVERGKKTGVLPPGMEQAK
jgi:hypothetical protein